MPETDDIEEIIRLHWNILTAMQLSSRPDWMELDMTMAQIKALFTISQGEAIPVSRIAEYLEVGQPTASHLVERLVRQGFASRSENPNDRRITLVRLTPKGEDLVRRLYQGGEELYRSWVKGLTDEERKNSVEWAASPGQGRFCTNEKLSEPPRIRATTWNNGKRSQSCALGWNSPLRVCLLR